MVAIPPGVAAMADRGPRWVQWVRALPATVSVLLERWGLRPDGTAMHGHCSLVLPVRTADDAAAVLKIGFPEPDSAHEHLALRRWAGAGAVRLLSAEPALRALLLERLAPVDLSGVPETEACRIVAGLYGQIHLAPLPQLRSLATLVEGWTAALRRLPRSAPIPRRLVEQAVTLGADLTADGATRDRLLHGDLHYGNVLAANGFRDDHQSWLVIDPKPVSGDPHYEIAPMLWNRFAEIHPDVRGGVRRRLWTLVDAAGLDEDRARAWTLVRMVHNAFGELGSGELVSPRLDRDWLTICVAVAKAVAD